MTISSSKTAVVGGRYEFIFPLAALPAFSWLRPGTVGVVSAVHSPRPQGAGHFDDDEVVVMEFDVDEMAPVRVGSTVIGSESKQVQRRVSFAHSTFYRLFRAEG